MKLAAVSPPVFPLTLRLAIALGCSLSCAFGFSLSASAQTIQNIDTAPNDTFGDRVIVDPGVTRIFGVLTPPTISDVDYITEATIERGEVNNFVISDLPPSEPFFAWMDTGEYSMSISMGLFEPSGDLIRTAYDSSPTGNYAPAMRGTVPATGTVRLKVTGSSDYNFDGAEEYYDDQGYEIPGEPHYAEGEYTLSVITGDVDVRGDIDFFSLTGLTGGDIFTVSDFLSEYGVRLAWIADSGDVVSESSYSDTTYSEQVSGIVPPSGTVHIAVTGYDDTDFEGKHTSPGEYLLRVSTQAVQ